MVSAPVRWAALLGVTAVSLAWLWRATGVVGSPDSTSAAPLSQAAPVVPVAARATSPITPPVVAPAAPPPVPYTYVGSWREGERLHLSLKRGDTIRTVTGLAPIDAQYVVVAADENQVSLRFVPLGTVQVIRREVPAGTAQASLPCAPAARNNDDTEAQTEN